MRRNIIIFLSVAVVLLSLFSFWRGANYQWKSDTTVEEGLLDLEAVDYSKEKLIQLNGEWEFYQGQLLEPQELEATALHKDYISVPASWDSYFPNGKDEIEAGTYRTTIKLPEDGNYGLRVQSIRNTSKVFINGNEMKEIGTVSANISKYEYREEKYEAYGQSENQEIEIVIQVASYRVPNGGIVKPIYFGKEAQISVMAERNRIIDGFVISSFFLLAIIFFSHFIQQNKSRYELYFSLFSFAQGFYVSTQNEKLIYVFLPNISNNLLLSMQLVLITLTALFFLLFIFSMFRKYASKRIVDFIVIILIIRSVYYATPIRIYDVISQFPVLLSQLILVVVSALPYLYFIRILLKAVKDKIAGTEYLLLATTAVICYGSALAMEFLFAVETTQLTLILFLLMGISFSFFIAFRRRLIYEELDELSLELLIKEQLKEESLVKTSKELIEPIESILHSSTELLEGREGPLKKAQQELIYTMKNKAQLLAQLVDDFRNAHAENDQQDFELVPIDLNVINEMIEELTYILDYSDEVVIENRLSAYLPQILANKNGLKQVVFHLLENAMDYMDKGKIIISAEVKQDMIYFSIEDSGIGIDEKYHGLLFDTFFQVPIDQGGKGEGMGLGLTITNRFVKLMKGEISVESTPNRGACFTFSLPIAPTYLQKEDITLKDTPRDEHIFLQETYPQKLRGTGSGQILIVDNDAKYLTTLSKMLLKNGYNVILANKSTDVPEILKKEQIDVAIINLKMPDISGIALSKMIREEYDQVELPILVMSLSSLLIDKNLSLKNGVNDFIRKPIVEEAFISRIQSLMAIRDAVQQSIENELKAYHSQITPHFLFNTLNTIIGLSYKDAKQTREALSYLSIYFRSKLDFQKQQTLVSLDDEIELVQAYLAIEKLRFGDRITIHYDIDETIEALIPAMTLQPLIENAFQHGLAKKTENATLWLSTHQEEDMITIVIEDNGAGIPEEKQEQLLKGETQRFGFKNPFDKLRLMKNSSFELHSKEGKGTKITIKLEARNHG